MKSQRRWKAIIHASELLTGAGVRLKDGKTPQDADLGRIPDGAMVYEVARVRGRDVPGRILWIGSTDQLPKKYKKRDRTLDLRGRRALVPGLVDCHTHLVFAGDRAAEFSRRCGGESYENIARTGGGIATTVNATRQATHSQLLRDAIVRIKQSISYGVRTLEIKSGYGLNENSEIKQLEVIRSLKELFPELLIQSTYLGAHSTPPEKTREAYVDEIIKKTLPRVASQSLADAVDVFIDQGYYTLKEGRRILERARGLGLQVKVHADELSNTESARLAAEMGALSADHLLKISPTGQKALQASQTTAVLLPGTAFYLKAAHAPARQMIDQGIRVAIATDFNPGTFMSLNLPAVMTIAALYLGMTKAELFASVTYNGACALGVQDRRGTLEVGREAAFFVVPFKTFEELYYRFAWSP